ncbi:hypothetical protein AGMMS49949_04780 [Alphaproteobacteria bacterium]|nr:hypothetical protein AGMMS49949_04780 [Alphaproteobacteria bacterium]GHS97237.1 hypothetical protein AGMMS50296_4060 [Alphaproteobacteria bacterium]
MCKEHLVWREHNFFVQLRNSILFPNTVEDYISKHRTNFDDEAQRELWYLEEEPRKRKNTYTTHSTTNKTLSPDELENRLRSLGEANVTSRNRRDTHETTKGWIFGIFLPWFKEKRNTRRIGWSYDGKITVDKNYGKEFGEFCARSLLYFVLSRVSSAETAKFVTNIVD